MAQQIEVKPSVPQAHTLRLWDTLADHPHDKAVTHRRFSAYYPTSEDSVRMATWI